MIKSWGVPFLNNFPYTQAFPFHADENDVIVVQLGGAKTWEVCAPKALPAQGQGQGQGHAQDGGAGGAGEGDGWSEAWPPNMGADPPPEAPGGFAGLYLAHLKAGIRSKEKDHVVSYAS